MPDVLAFARPSALAPDVHDAAEALWALTLDDRLADLLGLGSGDGHDELTRCEYGDCGAWHWADQGATLLYESGARLQVCAEHAVRDDPGARVYPGVGLEADLRERDLADMCARIRATGRPW